MVRYYLKLMNPVDGTKTPYYYWGHGQPNGNTQNSSDIEDPMWFENKEDAKRLMERVNSNPFSNLKEKYEIVEIIL